jgi:hypothetical protein
MNILKIAFAETIGMFIDDGALALLSLVMIVVIGFATEYALIDGMVGGILLIVGCLAILAESVARAARKKAAKS